MLCGVIQRSAGIKTEVPDPDVLRADFDTQLLAPAAKRKAIDPELEVIRAALGIG